MFTKYRELGLPLIPLIPGTKRPAIDKWSRFSNELPTEKEVEEWENKGYSGFGLVLGKASGLTALDIDTDDRNVLDACPPSPVRKVGRKGETRFFKYNSKIINGKIAGVIDVLNGGRQTVLPPTLHMDTGKPYRWITPDTLDSFDLKELPELTPEDIIKLTRKLDGETEEVVSNQDGVDLKGPFYYDPNRDTPGRSCPHGSQDRLKRIVNAMISRGVSPDEAVRELIRYDNENHFGPYFSDFTRGTDCLYDPTTNAFLFYASNLKTFNQRQRRQKEPTIPPLISGSELVDISGLEAPLPPKGFEAMPWPEPVGGLRDIRDLISNISYLNQPAIALGGAIAIASVTLANRLILGKETWPNIYVLNVAPTGAGKSFPYTVADKLLSPEEGLDLIGSGGYRSSSALMKDLETRRERLDVIDECASLFRAIRDGGIFQQDLLDILSALWSNSSSVFRGPEAAKNERIVVYNPCISMLFSTTQEGLKQSVSRDFLTHGLLPRCLIFQDTGYGEVKDPFWSETLAAGVTAQIKTLQALGRSTNQAERNLLSTKANPARIDADENALKLLKDYGRECLDEIRGDGCQEVKRQFLIRSAQQAGKLALIHAAFRTMRVEILDVEWAIGTLKAIWHNSSDLVGHLNAENAQASHVERVLAIILKAGGISQSKLIGKTRFLKTAERNEILHSLEDEGRIKKQVTPTSRKPITHWSIV